MPDEKELSNDNGDASEYPGIAKAVDQIMSFIESDNRAPSGGQEAKVSESGDSSDGDGDIPVDTGLGQGIVSDERADQILEFLFGISDRSGTSGVGASENGDNSGDPGEYNGSFDESTLGLSGYRYGGDAEESENRDSVNDLIDNGTLYRFDEFSTLSNGDFNSLEGGEQGNVPESGGSSLDIGQSFGTPGFTVRYSGDLGESDNGSASVDTGGYGGTATEFGNARVVGNGEYVGSLTGGFGLSEDEEGDGNNLDSGDEPLDIRDGDAVL